MTENRDKTSDSQEKPDSYTEVNFRLDEPRVTVGFKCNKKLWKAFVPFSKQYYGSVCHILEPIMIALLTSQVNLSKTIKPLRIENLNVARVVKRVRRYPEEEVIEIRYCEVTECNYRAKEHLLDPSGKGHYFCKKHADIPKLKLGFVRASNG